MGALEKSRKRLRVDEGMILKLTTSLAEEGGDIGAAGLNRAIKLGKQGVKNPGPGMRN